MPTIKGYRFECEACLIKTSIQVFYRKDGQVSYARARHLGENKKFYYHQQSLDYVNTKLRELSSVGHGQVKDKSIDQTGIDSGLKGRLVVGPPGFEPESIEPKSINWSSFKLYLDSKYAKGYATSIFEHSRKYYGYLEDVNQIQLAKPTARNNIINALIALSRYQGTYDVFKAKMVSHGIKRYKPDPIAAFTRIFSSTAHAGLGEWYNQAMTVLNPNEKLYLRLMLLSGMRAMEGINCFNLLVSLGSKYQTEYYNENTKFLEHFKYPKLFLRSSKNCYVSCVPKSLLDEISKSSKVSYVAIDKRLNKANLPMRVKPLRSYYATEMRKIGLLPEQIDLIEGRIGKTIFLMHYFKENPVILSESILELLPSLERTFKQNLTSKQ